MNFVGFDTLTIQSIVLEEISSENECYMFRSLLYMLQLLQLPETDNVFMNHLTAFRQKPHLISERLTIYGKFLSHYHRL